MIEIIFKRRPIREFLKKYPSDKWKEIIPDVLEIGVLNLKNSFNTLMFSKEDFNNILFDLRNFKPKKKTVAKPEKVKKGNNYVNRYKEPSIDENEQIDSYTEEEETFTKEYDDSVSFIAKKPSLAKAEVYVPNENDHYTRNRFNSKGRPRKGYYTTQEEIIEQNKENQRNLAYAESKIRAQILNDKMIHKAIKSNAKKQNENKNQVPNKKANYVINYDKNLTPESVQKFEKEPMYYYSNNNISNNNMSNTSKREVRDENSNYYNHYNNESELENNNNNLNYNYISNSDLNNSNSQNINNTNNPQYYDSNIGQPQQQMKPIEDVVNNEVNTAIGVLPVLNSLNTVETANFNNDNSHNVNMISNSNSNLYYKGNTNINPNYKSFMSNNNVNVNSYISVPSNEQEGNKENLSGDNEGELSMCNLSQRTKSIFKYINLI